MSFFVTGIDTNIGKTVVSAIFTKALKFSYFKPVQCGDLNCSDSFKIQNWLGPDTNVFMERYRLKTPASPHLAARIDGMEIGLDDFTLPQESQLIVEGAGGALVPLNEHDYVIDLAQRFKLPVILVTKNYLGSLNHTLMSHEVISSRGLKIAGLIFNGEEDLESQRYLTNSIKPDFVMRVPHADNLERSFIFEQALKLRSLL